MLGPNIDKCLFFRWSFSNLFIRLKERTFGIFWIYIFKKRNTCLKTCSFWMITCHDAHLIISVTLAIIIQTKPFLSFQKMGSTEKLVLNQKEVKSTFQHFNVFVLLCTASAQRMQSFMWTLVQTQLKYVLL